MDTICSKYTCTGCGACKAICPSKCISMQEDGLDALYPMIDQGLCVNCGLCKKICPNNRSTSLHFPMLCYAAWSKDEKTRITSASGGIAAELYRYAIQNNVFAVGVSWERERGAYYIPVQCNEDITKVKNSKYVFSDTDGIYSLVKDKLDSGSAVLFIGLPCQIAGLYGFLRKDYLKLTTVDIICHGVAPSAYLAKHLETIERKRKSLTESLSFRQPKYNTYTFTFSLSDRNGKEFYKNTVQSFDNYQLGYHHALIYRENCYQCQYARPERLSDITIGDFSGLGRFAECNYDRKNVNCVLVNTDKGASLIENICENVELDKRPLEEAINIEKQLQHPSVPHPKRGRFVRVYEKNHLFTKASNEALFMDKTAVTREFIIAFIKRTTRRMVPSVVIERLKAFVRNG